MAILKAQQGGVFTTDQIKWLGKQPNGPGDMIAQADRNNVSITDRQRRSENIHNNLSDIATGVATWGTQLRKPTEQEIRDGRAGGTRRVGLLARAATAGIANELVGGAMSVIPGVINKIGGRTLKQLYYQEAPWTFKPTKGAYYHRSPDLNNVINKEGNLIGFGSSEAGRAANEKLYTEHKLSLANRLKKPANSALFFSKDVPLDYGRYNKQQGYVGPYLIEAKNTPMQSASQGKRYGVAPTSSEAYAVATVPMNKNNVSFYKEDLIRGYKPIPTPR